MEGNIAERLNRVDSCAVSDALDKLGLTPSVGGILPRTVPVRIAGRVITVKLGPRDPLKPSTRHLCTQAIESARAGDVIVIEQSTGIEAAGWGGVLSNAAMIRGVAGCIIDGPARDIDEARTLGFPVYARSTTARTARGRIQEVETGGTILVGDVSVRAGDYVIADSSGIAFLPAADVERILAAAEEVAARDTAMTHDVHAGKPVSQVMGTSYENMLKRTP